MSDQFDDGVKRGYEGGFKDASEAIQSLQSQLKEARELVKELVELTKTHLVPIFNPMCEGCREAERYSRQYLSENKKAIEKLIKEEG